MLRVGASGALDAKPGKIIPSYREIATETSCPSRPAGALPRAGPALSRRWGLLEGVMVARVSQTIAATAGRGPQPITLSSVLEGHTGLRTTPGNTTAKQRRRS